MALRERRACSSPPPSDRPSVLLEAGERVTAEQRGGDEQLRLRSDKLEWREVEGEIVALDLESSKYLSVNQTGALLWPALADGATRPELIARLVQTFEIDQDTAAKDLDSFLNSLAEQNLLE